jgi:hypothetical protein
MSPLLFRPVAVHYESVVALLHERLLDVLGVCDIFGAALFELH